MMKLPLGLVIITLNEEHNIARCIQSVPFASEIIVVDSFSKDKTVSMAEACGARVVQRAFAGYRDQKQFALELATQPWVLSLDADECLSSNLAQEIVDTLQSPKGLSFDGFRMPRCSFHLGRWIRHGGWYPDYQSRLFKKEKAQWVGGHVHEDLKINGHVGTLRSDIEHFVFKDLEDQIETNNEFSSLGAKELYTKAKKFKLWKLIFKPMGKFMECYVWKRGFLDGAPGFIIALGAAQSMFLKFAKIWELEKLKKETGV